MQASSYGAQVTLNVSFVNDAPVAAADAYVNTVGGTLSIRPPASWGMTRTRMATR